jgi:sugar-specific transcriptional regulator TrmB
MIRGNQDTTNNIADTIVDAERESKINSESNIDILYEKFYETVRRQLKEEINRINNSLRDSFDGSLRFQNHPDMEQILNELVKEYETDNTKLIVEKLKGTSGLGFTVHEYWYYSVIFISKKYLFERNLKNSKIFYITADVDEGSESESESEKMYCFGGP